MGKTYLELTGRLEDNMIVNLNEEDSVIYSGFTYVKFNVNCVFMCCRTRLVDLIYFTF
jgi:hypothetical protein